MCWLMSPVPGTSAPPLARLPAVKADFAAAMADLTHDEALALARRIECAASLRELWHLRCDLHLLLSRHLSEAEAERRLVPLHRHFPGGLSRSSFRRQRI